ncbi:MAG: hypothetical protein ACKODX_13160 [Gemmata sp.]
MTPMYPGADAIFDPPADAPRLACPDGLQHHGQETYAKFIRSRCAAAHEPLWGAEATGCGKRSAACGRGLGARDAQSLAARPQAKILLPTNS